MHIVKRLLLLILLINLHVSAKDAWSCLVENEKKIINDFINANYGEGSAEVDTLGLVRDCFWINDSTSHVKNLYLHYRDMEDPSVLPRPLDTIINGFGELPYLEELDLTVARHSHLIRYLWDSISNNDRLKRIKADSLITLPKTIAGCEALRYIKLGDKLEYLPDELLDLKFAPFGGAGFESDFRGRIDICDCDENLFTLSEKQKEWANVEDIKEYKKRYCSPLSDSAIVSEIFRRSGYENIDISKAVSYYPNSSKIDSIIIRGSDYPNIKRINLWVRFVSMPTLKYLEISNIDSVDVSHFNLFRTYWDSTGTDTIGPDSLREIKFNNISNYLIHDITTSGYKETLNRKFFKKYSLRNCNLKTECLPNFHKYTKVDPQKVDFCGNDSLIFNEDHLQWFKEYGYNIETYADYEKYFCNNDIIEPNKTTSTNFNVSFANKQLQITLPQSMKIEKMKLLTIDGKIVKQFSVPTGTVMPSQFTLELNDTLSAGFYILSLDVGGQQFQKKFVVQ